MKQIDLIVQQALIENSVLDQVEIQKYLASATASGTPLKDFLLNNEIISSGDLLTALCQKCHLESVDFKDLEVDEEVLKKVPVKFALYYKFMPISIENNTLKVAASTPLSLLSKDEIRLHLGFNVDVCLAKDQEIVEAIKRFYGFASETVDKILKKEQTKSFNDFLQDQKNFVEDLDKKDDNDPTISHLVNQIILEAFQKRATDIHIEPYRNKVRFRYRIDGVLVDANLPEKVKHFLSSILSRIKILANLSITEKRLPQDGSAVVKTKNQHIDLRVSTMPTPRGESMVIRLLPSQNMLYSLERLGFDPNGVKAFQELVAKPHGIVFLTGPTGSGKTTTLYACLNEINATERKIITIEDPVEYEMEGITQVQVNPKVDFTFARGLRSILRHDPDILMVGEVRDPETAEIAIKTALTGHLVFSTLHTNDSASGVTRLVDMGLEPYLVSSSVEAFVAQRLIRVNCPKCKEKRELDPGIRQEMERSLGETLPKDFKIEQGKGCEFCNRTGFYGRVAIYEILRMNEELREAILNKASANEVKLIAMKHDMNTLRQNGWKMVLTGKTTPQEVLNVTTQDQIPKETVKEQPELKGDIQRPVFQKVPQSTPPSQPTMTVEERLQKLNKDKKVVQPEVKKENVDIVSYEESSQLTENANRIEKSEQWLKTNQYESRRFPRLFEAIKIRYRVMKGDLKEGTAVPDEVEYSAETEDISAGGLRFRSKKGISVGTIVELRIYLFDSQKSIDCLAKVCRLEQNSLNEDFAVLSYYLDITNKDRLLINNYVEDRLKRIRSVHLKKNSS